MVFCEFVTTFADSSTAMGENTHESAKEFPPSDTEMDSPTPIRSIEARLKCFSVAQVFDQSGKLFDSLGNIAQTSFTEISTNEKHSIIRAQNDLGVSATQWAESLDDFRYRPRIGRSFISWCPAS